MRHTRTSTPIHFPRVRVRSVPTMILGIWTATLIAARGPDILRLKAVIWADGFDTPLLDPWRPAHHRPTHPPCPLGW